MKAFFLFALPAAALALFMAGCTTDAVMDAAPAAGTYTCPMHPEIRQDEPGDCPICGMDLVPVDQVPDPNTDSDAETTSAVLMNEVCPLMGGDADPAIRTERNGKTVGFCCASCIPEWNELTDEQKAEKLAAAQAGDTENRMEMGHDPGDDRPDDA